MANCNSRRQNLGSVLSDIRNDLLEVQSMFESNECNDDDQGNNGSQEHCNTHNNCLCFKEDSTKGLSSYAYIYNLTPQTVPIEASVVFSNNGVVKGSIIHAPGTDSIFLGCAGDYAIWFYVAGAEANQFTLYKNSTPVAGSTYGSGAVNQPNPGQVIICAHAGDVLTIRNHTSATPVILQTPAGGTQSNVNASILIEKISK